MKAKDEAQLIREWGLQIGDRVVLKREGLKGTVRFIGATHFTFGVVVGLEMAGNGHGNHCGDIDHIRYFEAKRNDALFVRIEEIEEISNKSTKRKKVKYRDFCSSA